MSKNEAPENEITEFDKIELFVAKHTKSIVIGAIAVVLLVAAGVIVNHFMSVANEKSLSAIAEAQTAEELEAVITSENSHKGVTSAQLKLAKIYLSEKKYDKVNAVYTAILKSSAPDTVKSRIKLNQIAIDEVQGKIEVALDKYKKLGAEFAMSKEVRAEANYAVARILVSQGKAAEAKTLLTTLAADKSAWSAQADQMLKRL